MKIGRVQVRILFVLIFINLLISCGNSQEELRTDIIARDTMIFILADVQIFESTKQILKDRGKFDFELYKAYKWVFDKYGITEEKFRKSFDYYSNDPKDLELIYDEVIIKISEKQAEFSSS